MRKEIKAWERIEEGTARTLWGTGERNFEGLENEEDILYHFEIFWGHNCPSIV